MARPLSDDAGWPRKALLLDPFVAIPLSLSDGAAVNSGGIVAVDCSWNRLGTRGGYPALSCRGAREAQRRRLPFLLAGNAQHYGKLGELNTVEALAAAVYVLGAPERARELLQGSGAGNSFLTLNREPLEAYRSADDARGVEAAERSFF